jgi:hypothetical protein
MTTYGTGDRTVPIEAQNVPVNVAYPEKDVIYYMKVSKNKMLIKLTLIGAVVMLGCSDSGDGCV